MERKIEIDLKDSYEKVQKLSRAGKNGKSLQLTVPHVVVKRVGKLLGEGKRKASEVVKENMKAKVHFDGFPGVFIEFVEKSKEENAGEKGAAER